MAKKIKMITKINYEKISNKKNKFIVIHYVGNVSTAIDNGKYFQSAYRAASAHYFVDKATIVQSVKENDAAWAVGSNGYLDQGSKYAKYGHKHYGKCKNSNSISIEMCCELNDKGKLYIPDETVKRTAELVREIQKRWNIDDKHVIRHFDVNGKLCPLPYIEETAWRKLHAKLVGTYFIVKTKGNLIAREGSSLMSNKTRRLEKGIKYGIVKVNKKGNRGQTIKGDWITITDKYVEKV